MSEGIRRLVLVIVAVIMIGPGPPMVSADHPKPPDGTEGTPWFDLTVETELSTGSFAETQNFSVNTTSRGWVRVNLEEVEFVGVEWSVTVQVWDPFAVANWNTGGEGDYRGCGWTTADPLQINVCWHSSEFAGEWRARVHNTYGTLAVGSYHVRADFFG